MYFPLLTLLLLPLAGDEARYKYFASPTAIKNIFTKLF